MKRSGFEGVETASHDPNDPNPWLALYLDQSTPIRASAKEKWLRDSSSRSRQYLLPFARPWARTWIVIVQIIKALSPLDWRASKTLHKLIVFSLRRFVRPDANDLILRHMWAGSEILAFIAGNVRGVSVPLNPLKPRNLDGLLDDTILKHDLNIYNFIINHDYGDSSKRDHLSLLARILRDRRQVKLYEKYNDISREFGEKYEKKEKKQQLDLKELKNG